MKNLLSIRLFGFCAAALMMAALPSVASAQYTGTLTVTNPTSLTKYKASNVPLDASFTKGNGAEADFISVEVLDPVTMTSYQGSFPQSVKQANGDVKNAGTISVAYLPPPDGKTVNVRIRAYQLFGNVPLNEEVRTIIITP